MRYALGVLSGILAGCVVFFGQILQKKTINELKKTQEVISIFDLIKKPLWLTGLFCMLIFTTIFVSIAQFLIGPALIPGLLASGLIVLAIGSVKILGEKLKKQEYIAIGLLIVGIVFITLSRLSIDGDLKRFEDKIFLIKASVINLVLIILWFGLYYGGLKSRKKLSSCRSAQAFPSL